ncbi:hypothetical protein [Streptomyces sp. NPDC088736]|uniref:hypothetical protein n=1 Tax=Streptomyces sp. NPDC088736 TaxID=3365881 RepID=UPI00382FED4C
MSETGQTWQRSFKALPVEATGVRDWTHSRIPHPDAPLVAHELFVAVLHSGTDTVEVTLSTAGPRIRITATGTEALRSAQTHGPGWRLVAGLSQSTGITTDEHGLWAEMEATP